MKILILGAGSVGGYFGGRMAEAELDVTFLVRPKRKFQLNDKGLIIESIFGNVTRQVKALEPREISEFYDLIFLSCKAYDLESAMDSIKKAVGSNTSIIPLMNGLAQIEILGKRFGSEKVLGGVCYVGAKFDSDTGVIKHFGDFHRIPFGEIDGGKTERVKSISQLDKSVKFDFEYTADIMQTMWNKCAGQGALSSANILTRSVVGDIMRSSHGRLFLESVLNEGAAVCNANGFPMSKETFDFYHKIFDTPDSQFATSMLRDLESGNKTEGQHVIGDLVKRAEAQGINIPIIKSALEAIEAYEAKILNPV